MIRLPCCDCGSVDFPKVLRTKKLRNGTYTKSRSRRCIICARELQRNYYEKMKLNKKRYANRLRLNRKSRIKNKDNFKAYQGRYERLHTQSIRERKHQYYLDNKEKILARNKKWKDENRKKLKVSNKNHVWRLLNHKRILTIMEKK